MQFELPLGPLRPRALVLREDWLRVGPWHVRLHFWPNPRAGRYILRLTADGAARVTVPRGGSAAEARRFAQSNVSWLEKQLRRHLTQRCRPRTWTRGGRFLFRGELVMLEGRVDGETNWVQFGTELVRVQSGDGDLRPEVEEYLWRLAARELPPRVFEAAAAHQLPVARVIVRNQRSRWGSCSRQGTISLNWRLLQTPQFVQNYVILHELAHVKEMNHSRRFWREVARLCPEFRNAERWLKYHADLL